MHPNGSDDLFQGRVRQTDGHRKTLLEDEPQRRFTFGVDLENNTILLVICRRDPINVQPVHSFYAVKSIRGNATRGHPYCG